MVRYLKQGKSPSETKMAQIKIRETVTKIIEDVESNGDTAIKHYAASFDKWSANLRLSEEQIADIVGHTPKQVIDDIQFAQQQIRFFAQQQLATISELEVETLPGIFLGHKNIPVDSVGCYIPGGRYPMVASSHMSIVTAKVAGVKRIVACTPPIEGKIPKATVCAMHFAGADEIYILGGVQALA